jgi:hypothetical protein
MSIKVGKLWGNRKFQELTPESKLLYLYLVTNPNLNTVGVFCPNLDVVCLELSISMDQLRTFSQELRGKSYCHIMKAKGLVYYIMPDHFNTLPKSQSSIKKIQNDLDFLPDEVSTFLESIGIKAGAKVVEFKKPTAEEVSTYAMSLGHNVNGEDFVSYYDLKAQEHGKSHWVDGRGTQVKSWKSKLSRVWCKDENKVTAVVGAPKGYEYFNIKISGKIVYPDGWRNGKPYSKNLAVDINLKKEYERAIN